MYRPLRPIPVNAYNTCHMYNTYKYIQIPTYIDHYIQYIHMHINICSTCQYWYISMQMNTYQYINTYQIYNTYQYISIHINTDHYIQYMPVHTNQYNTSWYTHAPSNTDQYLSIHAILHDTCHVYNTNKYIQIWLKYLPIQTIAYIAYIHIPMQTIHANTHWYISIQTNTFQCIPYIQYVQYIQIHVNTGWYLHISMSVHNNTEYIPKTIHTKTHHNTYYANTCQYILQYKLKYILIHTMKSNTCQHTHITSLM